MVRTPGVPPRLPSKALLLQQELESFHFAACGTVLCLPKTVSYKGGKAPVNPEPPPPTEGAGASTVDSKGLAMRKKPRAPVTGACWEGRQGRGLR